MRLRLYFSLLLLVVGLLLLPPVQALSLVGAKVLRFKYDPIELCYRDSQGEFTCKESPHSELPNLQTSSLTVLQHIVDPGMVELNISGEKVWIFQDSVETDKKAKSLGPCVTQSLSNDQGTKVYASTGFGEGC